MEEEGAIIEDRDTRVSVDPGFSGVKDAHHHQQQQPLGGGRVRVSHLEEDWSDTFKQTLEEAGGHYSFLSILR